MNLGCSIYMSEYLIEKVLLMIILWKQCVLLIIQNVEQLSVACDIVTQYYTLQYEIFSHLICDFYYTNLKIAHSHG